MKVWLTKEEALCRSRRSVGLKQFVHRPGVSKL